jgi:hypothetical protein
VVKRHETECYVLDIIPGGIPFEPEEIASSFSINDYHSNTIPEDGDVIRDKSYDEIKRDLTSK